MKLRFRKIDFEKEISDAFIEKSQEDRELELIEKFYPGLESLTADEVNSFSRFDSLHKYQLHIVDRRLFQEKYNDKSEIIGASKNFDKRMNKLKEENERPVDTNADIV